MTTSENDFTNCFIQMSKPSENREELLGKIEEFVCHMYGFKRLKYVNEARTAMFQKTYKLLDKNDVFMLPKKSIDGSSLPPCKSELHQHFLRACFIAQIWSHAHLKVPTTHAPSDYGWEKVDDMYDFRWFSGNQLPSSITEITIHPEKGNIFENSIVIDYTYNIRYKYLIFYLFIDDDDEDIVAADSSDDSDTESERDESDTSQSESEADE